VRWEPHPYQEEAVKFGLEHPCAGFFLDPGLGKTSILYAIFEMLMQQGMATRMLVVAPLRVANSVWPREAQKWDQFKDLGVGVLHGAGKERVLERWDRVQVINPEGLGWLFNTVQKWEWPWDILVIDESTYFKHIDTQRFKTIKPQLKKFRRRYILTGSPAPNGLIDLFGQIFILDRGNALGEYITQYRRSYFFDANLVQSNEGLQDQRIQRPVWVPRKDAMDKIYNKIGPMVMRLSAQDCLNLEPYLENTIEVELPAQARTHYRQMEKLLITTVFDEEEKGEIVTAASAAAASQKCRQIANGGLYTHPESHVAVEIHEAKLDAVEDLVEELNGKPAIIAYEFHHDLQRLRKRFPGAPYLGGGVSAARQAQVEDAWNAGLVPVLLAQPQSVAHGLNLQGVGAAVIWHSLTFNLEHYEQLIRRVWRQGQSERVVVHHVVATDTVDEVMMDSIAAKDMTQQTLLTNLKNYLLRKKAA
jgi:hypothetical protein